jgi:hypothetical protein
MKSKLSLYSLFVLFVAIASISVSCQRSKTEEDIKLATLKAEVTKVHDDAMAKMSQLSKLKSELTSKMETIESQDSLALIRQAGNEIAIANEAMMNWMRDFSQKFPAGFLMDNMDHGAMERDEQDGNEPTDDLYEKLEEELVKISVVDKEIDLAIEKGKRLLEN